MTCIPAEAVQYLTVVLNRNLLACHLQLAPSFLPINLQHKENRIKISTIGDGSTHRIEAFCGNSKCNFAANNIAALILLQIAKFEDS